MSRSVRRTLVAAGRTLWAALVVALVAAVVVLAEGYPADTVTPAAPARVAVPPPAAVLVCPGPLRLATEQDGQDADYDPAFDPSPVGALSDLGVLTASGGDAAPATATGTGLGTDVVVLDAAPSVEAAVGGAADVTGSVVLRAPAAGDDAPWLAGALAWRTEAGDLRGLAAASCQRPAARTWLVGGSTALGSSARLVLQNPGRTPATVTIRMWGSTGALALAGAPDYLVAPGEEEVVLLEGLAAEQPQMVVEVAAAGGLVTAFLQDSRTEGLVPAGTDLVTPGAPPATRQVVPGIAVGEAPAGAPPDDTDDADDEATGAGEPPVLRLAVPGEEDGHAEVVLLGADGVVRLPGADELELRAGQVVDVPLGDLPPGDYAAVVTADVPVVAAAAVTRVEVPVDDGGDAVVERAWSPSVEPGGSGPLALPGLSPGGALAGLGADGADAADGARLVLAAVPHESAAGAGAAGSAAAVVEVVGAGGAVVGRHEIAVATGSALSLVVADLVEDGTDPPTGIVVRTEDERLAWAVVLDLGDMVSVLAPVAQPTARPAVPVTVR